MKEWHRHALIMRDNGWKHRQIAKHFGVSPQAVYWAFNYAQGTGKKRGYIPVEPPRPTAKAKAIIGAVCRVMKMRPEEALSICRRQRIVDARWAMYWLLRNELNYNIAHIGRAVGKDHTTVRHGLAHLTDKHLAIASRARALLDASPPVFQPAQEMRVTA